MTKQSTKKPARLAKLQALLAPADTVTTTITLGSKFGPKKPVEYGE